MARTTGALNNIRTAMLALGVCASLAAGSLVSSTTAEARVPQDKRQQNENAAFCASVQDTYDAVIAEWRNPNTPPARVDELQQSMVRLEALWDRACRDQWGSLNAPAPHRPGTVKS